MALLRYRTLTFFSKSGFPQAQPKSPGLSPAFFIELVTLSCLALYLFLSPSPAIVQRSEAEQSMRYAFFICIRLHLSSLFLACKL